MSYKMSESMGVCYVRIPENHIVIDFDICDSKATSDFSKSGAGAAYTEFNKSGTGAHRYYIHD